MLRQQQNQLITQTGPGTPMGNLFRCYWLPALLADELPDAIHVRAGRSAEPHRRQPHDLGRSEGEVQQVGSHLLARTRYQGSGAGNDPCPLLSSVANEMPPWLP